MASRRLAGVRALLAVMLLSMGLPAQTAGPRVRDHFDEDDAGHVIPVFQNGPSGSSADHGRVHPSNIIGGGAFVFTPIYHVAALEGATSGGTWLGYQANGTVSGTDAPTIATSAATPRVTGGNTTLITWDPNSTGTQAGQYVEFASTNPLLNLYYYGFLRLWVRSSATTTAGELTLTFLDSSRAAIGTAVNFPAIGTVNVWQAAEFDIRDVRRRLMNQIPAFLRITHTAAGAAEALRVEQMDAYQMSNGHGPVTGIVVQRVANAALARGSLVAGVAGQADRYVAGASNATNAAGIVVEGWLTGVADSIDDPTTAGDPVWIQQTGDEVYLEVAAAVTPAVGDPVAAVTATTFDDDEGAGRGIGTWREALAAGGHAKVALDCWGGNDDATLGAVTFTDDITWTAATPNLTINDGETITIADPTPNVLMTLADAGTTGNLAVTGTIDVNGSANLGDTTAGSNVVLGNSTGNVTILSDVMALTLTQAGATALVIADDAAANILTADLSATDLITLGNTGDNLTVNAGVLDVNASATTLDGTTGSIDFTDASNLSVTGNTLTVSTLTSGTLALTSAGILDLDAGDQAAAAGSAVTIDAGDGGGAGNAGGAITATTGAGVNDVSGSAPGALTLAVGASGTATTGTGGAAADITITGAAGGAATGAAGIGGGGGDVAAAAGAGGASSNAAAGAGGAGGAASSVAGAGGATTVATGGGGGGGSLTAGAGGAATGAAGIGGAGGVASVTGGAGGASSNAAGGNAGDGDGVQVIGGAGGVATNAASDDGDGGPITIRSGATGGATGSTAGAVTVRTGATNGGTAGTITIGDTNASNLALGNATGTFALASSGLDVSTAGILTNVGGITTVANSTVTGADAIGTDPTLAANGMAFGTTGLIFEGLTGGAGNALEGLLTVVDPTADRTWTLADATGTIALTSQVNGTIALGTDTTGNYAAGDAEAGNALTGDTATAFFAAGTIEHEYGGVEANVSAYTGIVAITGGATYELNTSAELATAIGGDLAVADGGTGLSAGTSGGILGYTAVGTLASSALLTDSVLMVGGGAGATPTSLVAGLGTATTVLHGNPAGESTWGAVVAGDITDIARSLPLPLGGWFDITARSIISVDDGADAQPDFTATNGHLSVIYDVTAGSVDSNYIANAFIVPADWISGGTIQVRLTKSGVTAVTENLSAYYSIDGAAEGAVSTVATAAQTAAQTITLAPGGVLAVGASVGIRLAQSNAAGDDSVIIHGVEFQYTASQ